MREVEFNGWFEDIMADCGRGQALNWHIVIRSRKV